jgi:hypothetical protein
VGIAFVVKAILLDANRATGNRFQKLRVIAVRQNTNWQGAPITKMKAAPRPVISHKAEGRPTACLRVCFGQDVRGTDIQKESGEETEYTAAAWQVERERTGWMPHPDGRERIQHQHDE